MKYSNEISDEITRLQTLRDVKLKEGGRNSVAWARVDAQIHALFWVTYPQFSKDAWLEE